jgi:hypothetical protein
MYEYLRSFQRAHEVIAATPLPAGSCGCLLAEITASGQYQNFDIRFSTPDATAQSVIEALERIRLPDSIDECLVGAVIPIVFGDTSWQSSRLMHTVYPTRLFVVDNKLEELAEIQLSSTVGWTYLNGSFGIVYSDDGRYVVELECWEGTLGRSKIRLDDVISPATLRAGHSKIDGCKIRTFYEISSDYQELSLKRISSNPFPNSAVSSGSQGT